jgi:hypothetical protein
VVAVLLLGEYLFRWRLTRTANTKRLAFAAVLVLLAPVGSHVSALMLSTIVAALLPHSAIVWLGNDRAERVERQRVRRRESIREPGRPPSDRAERIERQRVRWRGV